MTAIPGFWGGVLGGALVLFIHVAYAKLRNLRAARRTHRRWEAQRERLRKSKNASARKS